MKLGRTLSSLAAEIERQSKTKRDFIASTQSMALNIIDAGNGNSLPPVLQIPTAGNFPVNAYAHGQIAAHLDIPKKYYDKMLTEQPRLLAENVNTWFQREKNTTRRMVRTLDGHARAFLSDRFQPYDNDMAADAVLTALHDSGRKLDVKSCEITDRRLYIKVGFPELQADITTLSKRGDVLQGGLLFSNSEVGGGAVEVCPWSEVLACTNGMKHTSFGQRRNHVGRTQAGDDGAEIFASDTLRADAKAFLLKLRDVVRATCSPEQFDLIVNQMREAAGQKIEGNPVAAVEVLTRKLSLSTEENTSILRHLIEGGDLSRYGIANAVTRAAQDIESYDRATEMEGIGATIIELAPKDWREIALAA